MPMPIDMNQLKDWGMILGLIAFGYSQFRGGKSEALKQTKLQVDVLEHTSKSQATEIVTLRADVAALKVQLAVTAKERDDLKAQMNWSVVPPAVQDLVTQAATKNFEAITAQSAKIDHLAATVDTFLQDMKHLLGDRRRTPAKTRTTT
jgi:hypothetical protein